MIRDIIYNYKTIARKKFPSSGDKDLHERTKKRNNSFKNSAVNRLTKVYHFQLVENPK
jgi:hypothetical protein